MTDQNESIQQILTALHERAKELNCLYRIEELLIDADEDFDRTLQAIVEALPGGWQFADVCVACININGATHKTAGFRETPWLMETGITVLGEQVGRIQVCYTDVCPIADEGPFLKEERKLIDTIAQRIGDYVSHKELLKSMHQWRAAEDELSKGRHTGEWTVVLDLLRGTDQNLLMRISRKMINRLCWSGYGEAEELLRRFGPAWRAEDEDPLADTNRPRRREELPSNLEVSDEVFRIAARHLSEEEIITCLRRWIKEDKSSFLVNALENLDSSLTEIGDAMFRHQHIAPEQFELSVAAEKGVRVSLVRRFFSDQLQFIRVAKNYVDLRDFYELFQRMIFPHGSHGRLGGKGSGLFLASQIVKKATGHAKLLGDIKVPKTWYLVSDGQRNFIYRNNLEDVFNQKYKEIDQIREEYPYVIQVFKNSTFSTDVIKGLSMALDDFGDRPLIVRSSSLLEDRFGTAFCGKYKSLFLANQGTKQQRLAALTDAIAEVYASIFSPDPIEYRAERGLLDFHEEMGVLIEEVVGRRVGHYYLPAYAGVAFSHNEFRWSPRIKRSDGLIRIVPGLGTRAVDRLSDDYPMLVSPGQPGLRVNVTVDETVRYSPKKVDVINLKSGTFETVEVRRLLAECGDEYPNIHEIVSILDGDRLSEPVGTTIDFRKDDAVVTFNRLIHRTPFTKRIAALLDLLAEALGTPVDIEFACDGKDLYLLQCRPQSHSTRSAPSPIPHDVPRNEIIFSARRYVSNGPAPDATHIVYVDPEQYSRLGELSELNSVARVVGRLNKILPKRRFVLMGPGRWGSRGDVRLGVKVTYADISNTAMLIEIARKKGNFVPDLSFGTHFFQDLVESGIRYLPLYPDDPDIVFNEPFLLHSKNVLGDLLPEAAPLADTIRVIDVPSSAGGKVLRVLMNADLDEAVGILAPQDASAPRIGAETPAVESHPDDHWRWRLRLAERIAANLDPERFGVAGFYVFGSTKSGGAGPASDVDVLVHFRGSAEQRAALLEWLEGWSLCLSEMNFLRTGHRTAGLLDVHLITDEDIANRTSYASKIDAVTDSARPLPMMGQTSARQ